MTLPAGPGRPPVPSVCLVVLDGWGIDEPGPGNAVEQARTPVFDELWRAHPHGTLTTSGEAVGLPKGQMGNSEVGHLNLGAGAAVPQDLKRIDDAIADGTFARNEALLEACATARKGGRLHVLGLVSGGGVHSDLGHLHALVELAGAEGVPEIVLHAFTDGRDVSPGTAGGYLEQAVGWLEERGGRVATVCGRYYAMDRDTRWERTKLAYDAIVHGRGEAPDAASAEAAAAAAQERGETDEFIRPTVVGGGGAVRSGDAIVCLNFRPDRMRQLVRALGEPDFDCFDRGEPPTAHLTTLTRYREGWEYPVAFGPERPQTTLAATLAERGVRQLHVAETEKYAHVTYFFNGGEEQPHDGEQFRLVESPRDVATYDERPQMSARAAAAAFVESWSGGGYGFGVINFANADMVGHTGVIEAAVAAVEEVDDCLGRVVAAVHESGGACLVTADHGNAERMLDEHGDPDTAHSLNPVPIVITAELGAGGPGLAAGVLADVAPTVLELLGEPIPAGMSGSSRV